MTLKHLRVPDHIDRLTAEQFRALPKAKKANKYGAKPMFVDGIRFDSTLEGKRWMQLLLLERKGEIQGLERQKPYRLEVNGILIAKYFADFVYWENGVFIVEDSKGERTRNYIMKKRLMKAVHGIDIRETGKGGRLRGVKS